MSAARRRILLLALALFGVLAAYIFVPRHPDLRIFDPAAMASAETAMWRHYYEKRYAALFYDLYEVARDQQHFSPWESLSLALSAARAAKSFQPSHSRAEADAALPQLVAYFRVLSRAAPAKADLALLARTELDWWQARREAVPPETYGLTVARVSALLYGVDNDELRQSGILRAKAMAYRDARSEQMSDADWAAIAEQLGASYALLKHAVSGPPH